MTEKKSPVRYTPPPPHLTKVPPPPAVYVICEGDIFSLRLTNGDVGLLRAEYTNLAYFARFELWKASRSYWLWQMIDIY
jgi:hypothetical protein